MDVRFYYDGIRRTLWSAEVFSLREPTPATDEFWTLYPLFPRGELQALPVRQRRYWLQLFFHKYELLHRGEITQVLETWQQTWQEQASAIQELLTALFGVPLTDVFNEVHAYLTFHPHTARFPRHEVVYLYYRLDQRHFLSHLIGELANLVWFFVWQRHFGDDSSEYEPLRVKWLAAQLGQAVLWARPGLWDDFPYLAHLLPSDRPIPYPEPLDKLRVDDWLTMEELTAYYHHDDLTGFMEVLLAYGAIYEKQLRQAFTD